MTEAVFLAILTVFAAAIGKLWYDGATMMAKYKDLVENGTACKVEVATLKGDLKLMNEAFNNLKTQTSKEIDSIGQLRSEIAELKRVQAIAMGTVQKTVMKAAERADAATARVEQAAQVAVSTAATASDKLDGLLQTTDRVHGLVDGGLSPLLAELAALRRAEANRTGSAADEIAATEAEERLKAHDASMKIINDKPPTGEAP